MFLQLFRMHALGKTMCEIGKWESDFKWFIRFNKAIPFKIIVMGRGGTGTNMRSGKLKSRKGGSENISSPYLNGLALILMQHQILPSRDQPRSAG